MISALGKIRTATIITWRAVLSAALGHPARVAGLPAAKEKNAAENPANENLANENLNGVPQGQVSTLA